MQKYVYRITEFSNYDGDSFDLTLDLGFDLITHKKTRLMGIDTPELRGGTGKSKAAGYLAKLMAQTWITEAMDGGAAYFSSEGYSGKYGRPLGDILNGAGDSLREYLLEKRLGVPYEGQAKRLIQEQHDANIKYLEETGELKFDV